MERTEYSPHKIVHHPEILSQLRNKEHIFPLQVHLVPSNRCNQSCSFCAYRMHGYSSSQNFGIQDQIETPKLLEIIEDLADGGCKAIQYTGGGEPLFHRDIDKAIELTFEKGMDVGMVTNGVLFTDKTLDLMSQSSWVRVSADCFEKETYITLRAVTEKQYDLMQANVKKLAKIKSPSTVLGIGFVITKENYREVYQAARLFKEIGVDNIRISAAFTNHGFSYFDGWFEEARDEVAKTYSDLNDGTFTVFNLFDERVSDLFDGVQDYDFCPMKHLVPYVGADSNVYTCCTLAYNDAGLIGSIQNKKFSEMWYEPETVAMMNDHSPRRNCRLPCMFESKNKFINYCITEDAIHTNFI
ncbi:tungsten cofactor oxidoreductase radical SAM maturase [soil metagenome]